MVFVYWFDSLRWSRQFCTCVCHVKGLLSLVDSCALYYSSWSGRLYYRSQNIVTPIDKFLSVVSYPRFVGLQATYLNDMKRHLGSGSSGSIIYNIKSKGMGYHGDFNDLKLSDHSVIF